MAANISPNLSASVLTTDQAKQVEKLALQLSSEQLLWSSGYLAGLAAKPLLRTDVLDTTQADVHFADVAAVPNQSNEIKVLYGSESGNGQGIAETLADTLNAQGKQVKLVNMSDYRNAELKNERHLIIIVSTHGEGDPPEDAEDFYEYLMSKRAPKLPDLNYSVLALGDSSYAHFCETGRKIDERLSALGASAFAVRTDCDVDYQTAADSWAGNVHDYVDSLDENVASVIPLRPAISTQSQNSKQNPYSADLLVNQKITGRHSAKDVRHLELDISDSGLTFEPGDSLGVVPKNPIPLVQEALNLSGLPPEELVDINGESKTLKQALTEDRELSNLSLKFLSDYAAKSNAADLLEISKNPEKRAEFFASHQVIDVLRNFPSQWTGQGLVDVLTPIAPRLYSIASSPDAYPDEVHLTVDTVNFESFGVPHIGAASHYLNQVMDENEGVTVYVDKNPKFKLPSDNNAPVIMIGPGTGIAPFRSFLQHRDFHNAKGKNWLFFGAQHFESDYLYQLEWLRYRKSGLLTRLDTAFSRDHERKVYVQHLMSQHAAQVFKWLESGAYLYVCGDAKHMAEDVHRTLIQLVAEQGQKSTQDAEEYLKQLRKSGRYQKDVY